MIKPAFKTRSLSFVVLAAAVSTASTQSPLLHFSGMNSDKVSMRASQSEIDRGWERQQRLLDARLAARAAEGAFVPGAIIVPPFPSFAPYRTDLPKANARRAFKPATAPSASPAQPTARQ